ncbi:hypothetical protein BLNAU_7439 [Blattamonas nauphoetae]|uniref:Uncharacterized protein n=1 Tax=Blattamonas nauphoetae TaxID=2049346 RepID=A0ABQ9Y1D0_9EUKA|nr:hypothetical protein BLNAU_7439 [Blattamonas nauphoetae]
MKGHPLHSLSPRRKHYSQLSRLSGRPERIVWSQRIVSEGAGIFSSDTDLVFEGSKQSDVHHDKWGRDKKT